MTTRAFYVAAITLSTATIAVLVWSSTRQATQENAPNDTTRPPPQAASTVTSAVRSATGNRANDLIMDLPETRRAAGFTTLFEGSADFPCGAVTRTFYQGLVPKTSDAIWNVGCSRGQSYSITIKNDADGSTQVLDCRMLKLVAHLDCFVKYDEQK